jgi:hypothetical protein
MFNERSSGSPFIPYQSSFGYNSHSFPVVGQSSISKNIPYVAQSFANGSANN